MTPFNRHWGLSPPQAPSPSHSSPFLYYHDAFYEFSCRHKVSPNKVGVISRTALSPSLEGMRGGILSVPTYERTNFRYTSPEYSPPQGEKKGQKHF